MFACAMHRGMANTKHARQSKQTRLARPSCFACTARAMQIGRRNQHPDILFPPRRLPLALRSVICGRPSCNRRTVLTNIHIIVLGDVA